MIAAGLVLLAIGGADLLREFLPARARTIALIAGGVVVLLLAGLSDAVAAGASAVVLAAAWVWLAPVGSPSRAGVWPAVAVGVVVGVCVAVIPARTEPGLIGGAWSFATPVGDLEFDLVVLVAGAVLFLLESANVVVRAALVHERVQVGEAIGSGDDSGTADPAHTAETAETADASDPAESAAITPLPVAPALKGGRLIGPLERILVFALTLAAAYPLVVAILAAKGIVRFPEISRDSAAGNRAEYFLIGSLVSWVIALAAAFLVWWAFATTGP